MKEPSSTIPIVTANCEALEIKPGRKYAIELDGIATRDTISNIRRSLREAAPESEFLILPKGIRFTRLMERVTVYVVGQFKDELPDGGIAWEFQGVFSSRDLAQAACLRRDFFFGPAELDKALPVKTGTWKGCEYPLGNFETKDDYIAWKAALDEVPE